MGVNDLWRVVKETRESVSLTNLCTREMNEQGGPGEHLTRVGVDFNNLIDHCGAVAHKQNIHGQLGENAQLKIFFYKLCHFLTVPAIFLFVSDGHERPPIKRGKKVRTTPLWYMNYAIALINAFGFHHHSAPGEGEAELAQLNNDGLIDLILTDDSDALVFGAQCILRKSKDHKDVDRYYAYRAHAIRNAESIQLTQGGLVLYALVAGGDYNRTGVKGCGRITALALARCGFGDSLLHARATLSPRNFEKFLVTWREDIRLELRYNRCGFLDSCLPSVAHRIGVDFPEQRLLDYYASPATSKSGNHNDTVNPSGWILREPEISSIASFCFQRFGWLLERTHKQFRSLLWPGILVSMLLSKYKIYDSDSKKLMTPNTNTHLIRIGPNPPPICSEDVPFRRVVVSTANFVVSMGFAPSPTGPDLAVKIPECLLPLSIVKQQGRQASAKACQSKMAIDHTSNSNSLSYSSGDIIDLTGDEDYVIGLNDSVVDLTEGNDSVLNFTVTD